MSDTRESVGRPEESSSGPGDHPPATQPSVESIQILARALSGPIESALNASMEGFWTRLDARLESLTPSSRASEGSGATGPPGGLPSGGGGGETLLPSSGTPGPATASGNGESLSQIPGNM